MWYKSLNNYTVVDSESNSNYFDSRGLDFVNLLNQIKLFVNRKRPCWFCHPTSLFLYQIFYFLGSTELVGILIWFSWGFTLIGLILTSVENLKQLRNKMKRQGYLLADASRITSDLARLMR